MPSTIDQLLSHPALSARYTANRSGGMDRLANRLDPPQADDAVSLKLSTQAKSRASNPLATEQLDSNANIQGDRKRKFIIESYNRMREAGKPSEENESPRPRVVGKWANGMLKTNTGLEGRYSGDPERGQIKFTLGHLNGYVLPNSSGVLFNPKTGDSYRFDLKVGQGEFAMYNVEKLESKKTDRPEESKPNWEGEIKGNKAYFEGMTLEMLGDGKVKLNIEPNTTRAGAPWADKASETNYGEGFIDKNGNLVLAFKGGTFRADYAIHDGKFQIFDYELLG